jgi:hypothetical protein
MANALNEDLTGRYVVLREDAMSENYRDLPNRIFKVEGGFGAVPFTIGQALMGTTPIDGEKFRVGGYDVERFATDAEIASVTS